MEAQINTLSETMKNEFQNIKERICNIEARVSIVEEQLLVADTATADSSRNPILKGLYDILQEDQPATPSPILPTSQQMPIQPASTRPTENTTSECSSTPVISHPDLSARRQISFNASSDLPSTSSLSAFTANSVQSVMKNASSRHLAALNALPILFSKEELLSCNCQGAENRLAFDRVRLRFLRGKLKFIYKVLPLQ